MICSDPRLAALDRDLAARYAAVAARSPYARELRDGEVEFLNRRGRCTSPACIAEVYRDRIRELRFGY
ncbi:MAG: hypothetical protein JO290_01425 [Sphingomonadaceae bacterium]|nr:hypothetical protein [Sphingomonadaceae bacterium]